VKKLLDCDYDLVILNGLTSKKYGRFEKEN